MLPLLMFYKMKFLLVGIMYFYFSYSWLSAFRDQFVVSDDCVCPRFRSCGGTASKSGGQRDTESVKRLDSTRLGTEVQPSRRSGNPTVLLVNMKDQF